MNSKQLFLLLGFGFLQFDGWSQTAPPRNTSSTTTSGSNVSVPDSGASKKPVNNQRQTPRHANPDANKQASGNTSSADGHYRQSSAANGTAVNSSNTTNYNSNNVSNAPTGVGSNPSVLSEPISPSSSGGASSPSATGEDRQTGTQTAVSGAKKEPTPAVVAGSTERNTSIHDFIASSPNYITLQNALQAADLNERLKESGPYTLFAPTNTAFKRLPTSVQAGLLEGRNRNALKQLLTYHLVEGTLTKDELVRRIKANGGKTQLRTQAGSTLMAQTDANGALTLTDGEGKTTVIETSSIEQSNGIVYGISAVLLPKAGINDFR